MDIGTVKRAALMGGASLFIVGAMLASAPDEVSTPRARHAASAKHALAGAQAKHGPVCTGVCDAGTPDGKGAWDRVDWTDDGKPNHVKARGVDPMREYEKITEKIARDVKAGYSPPPIGEETEGDAQARILSNCRAGFTSEDAPATGSGTMGCDELEEKALEDATE